MTEKDTDWIHICTNEGTL